jgi:hypothetical protein
MKYQIIDRTEYPYDLPATADEVVDLILSDLTLRDKVVIANFSENELRKLYATVGAYITEEFDLLTGNDALLSSCREIAEKNSEAAQKEDPAMTIIREIWKKLKTTHMLRVVK